VSTNPSWDGRPRGRPQAPPHRLGEPPPRRTDSGNGEPESRGRPTEPLLAVARRVASLQWSPPGCRRADGRRRAAARRSWPGSRRRSSSTCARARSDRRAFARHAAGDDVVLTTYALVTSGVANALLPGRRLCASGPLKAAHPQRGAAWDPPEPADPHFSSKTSSRADSERGPGGPGEHNLSSHNLSSQGAGTEGPDHELSTHGQGPPRGATTPTAQAWKVHWIRTRPVSLTDAVRSPPCLHLLRVGTRAPCRVKYPLSPAGFAAPTGFEPVSPP
jgi:hypothetical protein